LGYRFIITCCLALVAPMVLHAQTSDTVRHLPPKLVEITASRASDLPTLDPRGAEIKPVAALVNVTASPIASEALRAMSSSLDIRRYGTLGAVAVPSFRGLPSEYTIIFRDGVRLTNEQLGLTDLAQLTLHGTGYVELIPSSNAVLLGGDAVGAALNFVSTYYDTTTLRVASEQTTYAHGPGFPTASYFGALALRPVENVTVYANASLDRSSGNFPFLDTAVHRYVSRENNDAKLSSGGLNAAWTIDEQSSVRLTSSYFTIDRGLPGAATTPGRGASTLTRRQADEQSLIALRGEHKFGDVYSSLALSYQEQYESYTDRAYSIDDHTNNQLLGGDLRISTFISSWLEGFGGVEALHTRLTGTTNVANSDSIISRTRLAGYVAAKVTPAEPLSVTASLRTENISDVNGTQWLPQISARYQFPQGLAVDGAFSRSFHAPTLNGLYWRGSGNPNLQSEHAENWQGNIAYQTTVERVDAMISAAGFSTVISDEILWVPAAGMERPINIRDAKVRGLEFQGNLRFAVGCFTISAEEQYTVLDATNETSSSEDFGKELPYTTPTSSLFVIQASHESFGTLALLARYRGHRFTDIGNLKEGQLPPVTTYDLTYTFPNFSIASLGSEIRLGITDITDVQYQEALSYPLPGRTINFSIELNYH
jgi:vitamin B12 transporter